MQGTLWSFSTAANVETKRGPKLMERGDVGWAGEGPGPDFFGLSRKEPARHFGRAHTVFAVVADEASMEVLELVGGGAELGRRRSGNEVVHRSASAPSRLRRRRVAI